MILVVPLSNDFENLTYLEIKCFSLKIVKRNVAHIDLGAGHLQLKIANPGPKNTLIPGALGEMG